MAALTGHVTPIACIAPIDGNELTTTKSCLGRRIPFLGARLLGRTAVGDTGRADGVKAVDLLTK